MTDSLWELLLLLKQKKPLWFQRKVADLAGVHFKGSEAGQWGESEKQLFETWFCDFPFVRLTVSVNKTVNINKRVSLGGEPGKANYGLSSAKPL